MKEILFAFICPLQRKKKYASYQTPIDFEKGGVIFTFFPFTKISKNQHIAVGIRVGGVQRYQRSKFEVVEDIC